MKDVGTKLKARARELGLPDSEIARRLNLAQGRYSNYVNGNREPSLAMFVKICRALGVTPNDILGFEQPAGGDAEDVGARAGALLSGLPSSRQDLALEMIRLLATHQE